MEECQLEGILLDTRKFAGSDTIWVTVSTGLAVLGHHPDYHYRKKHIFRHKSRPLIA